MRNFSNFEETSAYLDEISKTGSILGLDNIRHLMAELGNPQDELAFIHIAGTNGKGSILAYTTNILKCAGYKVGTYLSPTVLGYMERFQINGEWMKEEELPAIASQVANAADRVFQKYGSYPTVFEVETAIAWLYFKQEACDFVVLECGMGGETDSTNIVKTTKVCAFASISMDHMGFLGNSLKEIATVKSGIIKPGATVVTGFQKKEARDVLIQKAESFGCDYVAKDKRSIRRRRRPLSDSSEESQRDLTLSQTFSYREFKHMTIHLLGSFQPENAATALEIVRALRRQGIEISDDAVENGLASTRWPGRFEMVWEDPLIIIDGAHNKDAALRQKESIEKFLPDQKIIAVLGVFKDKEYQKMASILAGTFTKVHTMELPNKARTLSAEALRDTYLAEYKKLGKDVVVTAETSMENAVDAAVKEAKEIGGVVLVSGSLSYLGETKKYILKKAGDQ
ncbi:MAG: bifunctional folylpolyglutamate synthase/dihydrofolate synthase [Dorea sp.]|nr:bifunctional folylpolyglutamate synthase/dihydrofolate synthase [Dorea sp.]